MENKIKNIDTSEYGIPSVGDFFWYEQELFKGDFHEVLSIYKRLNPSKKWRIWLIDNGYRVQVVPMPNPIEGDVTASYAPPIIGGIKSVTFADGTNWQIEANSGPAFGGITDNNGVFRKFGEWPDETKE